MPSFFLLSGSLFLLPRPTPRGRLAEEIAAVGVQIVRCTTPEGTISPVVIVNLYGCCDSFPVDGSQAF